MSSGNSPREEIWNMISPVREKMNAISAGACIPASQLHPVPVSDFLAFDRQTPNQTKRDCIAAEYIDFRGKNENTEAAGNGNHLKGERLELLSSINYPVHSIF